MDDRYGIPLRESESVEFKESLSELSKGMKSACAMLNSSMGGSVFFGVRDSGDIVGIQWGQSSLNRLQVELDRLSPSVTPDIRTVDLPNGKIILSIHLPGSLGPFRYQGRAYTRINDSDTEMPEEEYHRRFLERHHSSVRWELCDSELTIADIDTGALELAVNEAVRANRMAEPGHRLPFELLEGLGLVHDGKITRAAAALFGREEVLRVRFPQCKLKLGRFDGITKASLSDNRQYIGNLFQLLRHAQVFLRDHIPVESVVLADQIQRRDRPIYNSEALREALVNAFAHRDYADTSGAVDIAIFDDRLEIVSTGGLKFGLQVSDLLKQHQSRAWNPLIANVLQQNGIFENWGRGTLRIIELSRLDGLPDPVFVDSRHNFTVKFFSPDSENGASLQSRILASLSIHGEMSLSELVSALSGTSSARVIQLELGKLREAGVVKIEGTRRWAKWSLRSR
ncbi:MAG: putative DNA binding domain-containing protein [Thermomicrobiales bacterium]|nr:putative DNA binding domain-containing protein [Thermomicrobiales bacterium]MCO5228402.1 putative DNA binding domain-containing protein [Thermomicrobiales bacterium]